MHTATTTAARAPTVRADLLAPERLDDTIAPIARVVPETLSDGSQVYNVCLLAGDHRVTLYATDQAAAERIADALNGGDCLGFVAFAAA